MLAQLVLAGKLPPVEERVPDPPLVIPVFREIGKYGGTARRGFIGPTDVYCNAGPYHRRRPRPVDQRRYRDHPQYSRHPGAK